MGFLGRRILSTTLNLMVPGLGTVVSISRGLFKLGEDARVYAEEGLAEHNDPVVVENVLECWFA